jgi:hypothetical protein
MPANPTVDRLEEQITWYDRKSILHQRWYKTLKVFELVAASVIPFSAGLSWPSYITGGLGVTVAVLLGLQSLNQFHLNWITYRSTCEELKHEKYLWLGKAGPYANIESPDTLLAERVESLVSREHSKWVAGREQTEQSRR